MRRGVIDRSKCDGNEVWFTLYEKHANTPYGRRPALIAYGKMVYKVIFSTKLCKVIFSTL